MGFEVLAWKHPSNGEACMVWGFLGIPTRNSYPSLGALCKAKHTTETQVATGTDQRVSLNLKGHKPLVASLLLGAKGIATRNKDATRGSWPYN